MVLVAQSINEAQGSYLSAFQRSEAELANAGPRWLHDTRRAAMERFSELGFPTSRNEDWKFSNIAAVTGISFERAIRNGAADRAADLIRRLPFAEHRLVFVNGYYAPALSSQPKTSSITIASLRDALQHGVARIEPNLSRYANWRAHAFIALNTAFLEDGAFVYIPAGAVVDGPIHLIHVSVCGSHPQISHPRNLIVLGERSQASLIETHVGLDGSPYLANAVTEIVGGEEAIIDYYKLQIESGGAFHIATVQVDQGRGCIFRSHSVSFGGALARTEVNAVLKEGSECTLNGLYVAGGNQHVDTRTSIDHASPHGTSHELYKGILSGRSSAVFNGKILVRKDAQKTDAKQTNKNLVLSEDSMINTKPELQIHADDVRCTHGATIGQLDEEAIFYLQSRGISRDSARELLTSAFAREIIDGIKVESLRSYAEGILTSRVAAETGARTIV